MKYYDKELRILVEFSNHQKNRPNPYYYSMVIFMKDRTVSWLVKGSSTKRKAGQIETIIFCIRYTKGFKGMIQ